jgi:putative ABC transport system permease protein
MRLRQILRGLMQLPTFTSMAVATLAVGIGANTAMFSVVQGILLKALPYPSPDELIAVDHAAPGVNIERVGTAPFMYFTYRDDARTIRDIGLWRSGTRTVTGVSIPEEVPTIFVTAGILPLLGVQPTLGRLFSESDDAPGSTETVILTGGYWRAKFGGDSSAIGRRILLDGRPTEVIGVLPETFRFLDREAALLLPVRLDRNKTFLGQFNYAGLARLRPGVTVEQAKADFSRLIPISLQRFPPFPGGTAKMFEEARITPTTKLLKDSLVGDVGTVLWVLMGTIGTVLLIACANVANLLLVRAEGRQQELAIRAALGASRSRIARELLAESVILGLFGGAIGVGLAYAGIRWLLALAPGNLPRLNEISIDSTVLLFTLAISLLAGLLFGIIPVVKYAGPRISAALRAGGRTASDSRERHRARNTLVVVQVALALVLLVSSALMIRTFEALRDVQPGFTNPDDVLTFRIGIPETQVSDPTAVVRMEQAVAERIASVSGVQSVAMISALPLDGESWSDPLFIEGKVYGQDEIPPIRRFRFISPGLNATMGRRIVAGREFTWTDIYEKRPVVLLSENLARENWGEPAAAIGKRVRAFFKGPWREVIGVVADGREDGLNQKSPAIVYWPILMSDFTTEATFVSRTLSYVVRSSRTGQVGFLAEVNQAVWAVNANLPLAGVRTLQELYDKSLARTSFTLVMLAMAGAMALLLGLAGIYGVISYSVSQRTREIGIRMALGARNQEVTRMFLGHGARLAVMGVACGLATAFAATRLLTSFLFDVSPVDPVTYAAVATTLLAATMLASYVPAVRATAVDPVDALRAE